MISLIHPSRGRAKKAFNTAKKWIENAGCEVEYILSIDDDDKSLLEYTKLSITNNIICNNNSSVVEATNKAAEISKGDIIIYLSDDFDCFPDWGLAVQKEFDNENRPLLIKVDDCLHHPSVPVLTIPIMNRALYNKLGYFWHPSYKSMFCDEDLYWTCYKIGSIKAAWHLKFEHQHCSVGKSENDETYKRSSANWDSGKAMFAQRKALGFPL
jgi:glycosyltransferase involved in cell wall biosynthesis